MDRIGDYRIVRKLGEGNMGSVLLGQHVLISQQVAIKALRHGAATPEVAQERFLREAEVLARLSHENIVRLLSVYDLPEGRFILMEYVEGQTLEEKLAREGRLPWRDVLGWVVQALRGLGYAHAQGVIHRDLKPGNLLLAGSGTIKLVDFGLAKLTGAKAITGQGRTIGTLAYMSREQALGRPIDARSDLYSLGASLFELVTGRLPFATDDPRTLLEAITTGPAPAPRALVPDLPEELEHAIVRALDLEPERRFATAEAFTRELEHVLNAG